MAINTDDKNKPNKATYCRPLKIAIYDNIPIQPARIIGGCGPTKQINKIIVTIAIQTDIFFPNDCVAIPTRFANIDIFIPERTTMWSRPTVLS